MRDRWAVMLVLVVPERFGLRVGGYLDTSA